MIRIFGINRMKNEAHGPTTDSSHEPLKTRQTSTSSEAGASTAFDRLFYWGFLLGGVILCCQLGMLFAALDWAPYRMTENALVAIRSLKDQYEKQQQPYDEFLWERTPYKTRGVVQRDPGRMAAGYTIYGTGGSSKVHLIDSHGEEVHRWDTGFSKVWSGAEHLETSIPEDRVIIRRAEVFPNGDLLALYETTATTPNGIGLAKFDRESRLLWRYKENTHHDLDIAEDGTIYVLTHRINSDEDPKTLSPGVPFIEDTLSVLSPDGREIKTFSLHRVFAESQYCRPKTMDFYLSGDFLHSNTINIVGPRFAEHYESISPGDLMICLRNLNLVVVIDPQTEEIVWGTTGPWHHPHDPDPLPNGNLLMFDNYFVRGQAVGSRVIEFDPRTGAIAREFAGDQNQPFRSDVRACQQRLKNGNILITESDRGRLLEVAEDGEIVWEYRNPVIGGDNEDLIPIVVGGRRLEPARLPFLAGDD